MENPLDMKFQAKVRPENNGQTLLSLLVERFTYHTETEWMEKIAVGDVLINGEKATPELKLKRNDSLCYVVHNYQEPKVPTDFEVVFEDDEFALLAKPAGIPIHHTGKIFYNTFVGVVRRYFKNEEMMPLHRLDRDTSGLMLFAKSHDTAKRFQKNLDRILLEKHYLAIVPGNFPESLVCSLPLAEKADSEIRSQMFSVPNGKPSETIFKCLARTERSVGILPGPFSLLDAELKTGRKHQIRAHLAALGFPILGDKIYSHEGIYYLKKAEGELSPEDYQILGAPYQLLCAYKVLLYLPYWDEPKYFKIPIPVSWPQIFDSQQL